MNYFFNFLKIFYNFYQIFNFSLKTLFILKIFSNVLPNKLVIIIKRFLISNLFLQSIKCFENVLIGKFMIKK